MWFHPLHLIEYGDSHFTSPKELKEIQISNGYDQIIIFVVVSVDLVLRPKRASRVSVAQVGILVFLVLQENEVHLVCQDLVVPESTERRVARGSQVFMVHLENLVGNA